MIYIPLPGNHILPEDDLAEFFARLLPGMDQRQKPKPEELIPVVVNFVRKLAAVDDLEEVGREVFA